MIHVFISGPFRGLDTWAVTQNINRAEEIAFQVLSMGHVAVCPHTMYRNFDRTLTDAFWLEVGLELLSSCDCVLVCPGWEQSVGTLGEIASARADNKPVFYSIEELREGATKIRYL
jgi:hypothetical protein